MKLSTLTTRLSACLALCLCPTLLGHCGGATNDGLLGTETGNPPVVDSRKLRLVAGASGVELIGEAGAVPSGAQLRLDNRSTGASAVVTAGADGSFQLELAGSPLDTYEVTVTDRGGTVTLGLQVQAMEATELPGTAPSALSCEQLESSLGLTVNGALEPFAQGCTRHSDCQLQFWGVGCYYQCGFSYVVAAQQAAAVVAAEQSIAPACAELESRCERQPPASCPLPTPIPECNQGTCRVLSLDGLGCDDLETRAGELLADAFASVDRRCTVDADCTVAALGGLSCVSGCGFNGAVASSALASLQQSLQGLENGLCNLFNGRACTPPMQPSCTPQPPARAVCADERCTLANDP